MNFVRCPNCGNDNKSTNARCEVCGELLIAVKQLQKTNSNSPVNILPEHIKNERRSSLKEIFDGIATTIMGAFACFFVFFFMIHGGNIAKIVLIPFLICALSIPIYGIAKLIYSINKMKNTYDYANETLNMDKVEKNRKTFEKTRKIAAYILAFGVFLFCCGFLIVFDIEAIKTWSNGGSSMFFGTLICWFICIFIFVFIFKQI